MRQRVVAREVWQEKQMGGTQQAASGMEGPEPQGRTWILAVRDGGSGTCSKEGPLNQRPTLELSLWLLGIKQNGGQPRSWVASLEAPKFPSPGE